MKRILLVDDEYDVNLMMKLVLEKNGFKVDSITVASEALENFTTGLNDLVMFDVECQRWMDLDWIRLKNWIRL